jgi:hypothetical protein
MAALTASKRQDTVMGNKRVVLMSFAAVADGDTYATGFLGIDAALWTPNVATEVAAGASFSGGTVTLQGASATGGTLVVIGV